MERKGIVIDSLPDVMTPEELLVVLPIGRNSLYKLLKANAIKSLRVGKKYLIPKACLVDFLHMPIYTDTTHLTIEAANSDVSLMER